MVGDGITQDTLLTVHRIYPRHVLTTYLFGLAVLLVFTTLIWVVSLIKKEASIIDLFWAPLFVVVVGTYAVLGDGGTRATLVVTMVVLWAVRLGGYLTWRNWGEPEDYRYQAMRRRRGSRFPIVSLVTVFWLQAAVAWVVSAPLLVGVDRVEALSWSDWVGAGLVAIGFSFEAVSDWQLARFRADGGNGVLDEGLWALSRHPNYFGNAVMWWGFYVIALGVGGWWTIFGPLTMSFFLLKVSGVAMLEKTITKRRPEYAAYIAATNAFIPGRKRVG